MDDVHIYPEPNPALTELLKGPKMWAVVRAKTEFAKVTWQILVAKRSRKLMGSARTTVTIGGYKSDRPVGRLVVGQGLDYGAAHQFGHKFRRRSSTGEFVARGKRQRGVRASKTVGARELNETLRRLKNS